MKDNNSLRQITLSEIVLFVLLLGACMGWGAERYRRDQAFDAGRESERRTAESFAAEARLRAEKEAEVQRIVNIGLALQAEWIKCRKEREAH